MTLIITIEDDFIPSCDVFANKNWDGKNESWFEVVSRVSVVGILFQARGCQAFHLKFLIRPSIICHSLYA